MRFEEAAGLRDLVTTVEEMEQKQKMAAAEGNDSDIFAYYAEAPMVAVNLFHLRNGSIVDRREFFWEDQLSFDAAELFSSLLKQIYLEQQYVPRTIHVPVEFEDRETLEELLTEKRGRKSRSCCRSEARKGDAQAGGDETRRTASRNASGCSSRRRTRSRQRCRTHSISRVRRIVSSVSTSRTSRGPTRWRAWWCGRTGG